MNCLNIHFNRFILHISIKFRRQIEYQKPLCTHNKFNYVFTRRRIGSIFGCTGAQLIVRQKKNIANLVAVASKQQALIYSYLLIPCVVFIMNEENILDDEYLKYRSSPVSGGAGCCCCCRTRAYAREQRSLTFYLKFVVIRIRSNA